MNHFSNISCLFSEIISMLEKDGKVHFDRTDYENMLKKDLQYVKQIKNYLLLLFLVYLFASLLHLSESFLPSMDVFHVFIVKRYMICT